MVHKKISLLIIVITMIFSFNLSSQATNSAETQSFENSTTYFSDSGTDSAGTGASYSAPSTRGFLIKTIIALILVCAAIYGIMYFFKKKNNTIKSDDDFLRRVSSLDLAPGKSIEIVSLVDHAYILGVTDSNINLLGEVQDKELIEAMNLNFDKKQNVKKPMNFSDVLEIFMPKGPKTETSIYQDAENKVNNITSSGNEE